MTEKRFTVDSDGKYLDRITQCYVTIDYLADLANHLTEENEQLKKEKELLIQALSDASRNTVDMLLKGDVE
ncbi:MAG: hypothetical protein IJG09_01590 [Methanobrevibacter sp.]|nr:hypothetical protein [Methanobrevibacter sp.]